MVSQNEKEIESVLKQFDPRTAGQIRPIIYVNQARGRISAFLANDSHTLEEYIQIVADNYGELSGYLHQRQVVRSKKHWRPLMIQIHQWGYAWFLRKGYLSQEAALLVEQSAENTALEILLMPFPYDIDFDVWIMVITEKNSRRFLARQEWELIGS
jgi:hypothetical protein